LRNRNNNNSNNNNKCFFFTRTTTINVNNWLLDDTVLPVKRFHTIKKNADYFIYETLQIVILTNITLI